MQEIIAKLIVKDDKYTSAVAERIISESQDTDKWYEYFGSIIKFVGFRVSDILPSAFIHYL